MFQRDLRKWKEPVGRLEFPQVAGLAILSVCLWSRHKRNQIQYDWRKYWDKMEDYCDMAVKPENQFVDEKLALFHKELVKALQDYLWTAAVTMVPCQGNDDVYVIGVEDRALRQGWIEDYDKIFDKEVDAIQKGIDAVEAAWEAYVYELRSKYPEITHELTN